MMVPTGDAVVEKPQKLKLPSPQERLELVLLGLIREQTVEKLCSESGVSKALFYQWLKRARQGLLKALEAKKPGRKASQERQSPEDILKLQERVRRMEEEQAQLRRENARYKRDWEVATRVIQRNGWNPEPPKKVGRPKKKDGRTMRPGNATSGNGKPSGGSEPPASPLLVPGESAGAPTGDGSTGKQAGSGQG